MQLTRKLLRTATRATHDEIDEAYWSTFGFDTFETYQRLLQNMQVAYRTLGIPAAAEVSEFGGPFPAGRFADALCDDQYPLAAAPPEYDVVSINQGQAWGIGYALVGSCAGAKMMINSGHLKPAWGTHYLTAASEFATQGGVARFFKALDAAQPNPVDATAGAHAVFECLRAPLRHNSMPAPRTLPSRSTIHGSVI